MALLIVFGFVAGAATAVSPCVLPVLPVALSAGATGGKRRPLGVVVGLALSFAFATVALVYLIDALGLPDDLIRNVAIAVLVGFGLMLLVPPLADRAEAVLTRIAPRAPAVEGDGFRSGLVLGGGLGLVYAPCAGPILAGVITVSASQDFGAGRLAVALAYGIGTAVVLYVLLVGGRRLIRSVARGSGRLQAVAGAVMVATGLAMFAQLDIRFQNAIATDLPSALVNPTERLERSSAVADDLASVRGRERVRFATAPEFVNAGTWFNTGGKRPTMQSLRGRVVLVDFWTYSCINCIRTFPYLRAWDAKYRDKGLTIIGVHSPEFPFERDSGNVRSAIERNRLRYPIVQDNDYDIWDAYGNEYWPAHYLIDARGRRRVSGAGEGGYAALEHEIRSLLSEANKQPLGGTISETTKAERRSQDPITPELYLGSERAQNFAEPVRDGRHDYGRREADLLSNSLRYGGVWNVRPGFARAGAGATIDLEFEARRVFIVLGSPDRSRRVRVLLDGRPVEARRAGSDVEHATATIGFERLYRLIDLDKVEEHRLTLRFDPGVQGYAFTFG